MKTAEMVCNDLARFEDNIRKIRSELTDLRFDLGNDCINLDCFFAELGAVQVSLTKCANKLARLKALFPTCEKISEKKESL